jgi:hypothetical protein
MRVTKNLMLNSLKLIKILILIEQAINLKAMALVSIH